ncbi:ribosome maturation factor RimM [Candidatus Sneabacter namystus]|uniref:Ribosome maturation factor RimM n=1 Tax=Candidatus Sneabacter namystus TaxID=2601646 RepID=A0A5C0UHG8_9RICK|nr:ribosome maturation factor RimM [Candidatus Sneabacter namystus]QEK39595.1 16S rRNA processing protein RimM [Candidatus Sneabacter namystus]
MTTINNTLLHVAYISNTHGIQGHVLVRVISNLTSDIFAFNLYTESGTQILLKKIADRKGAHLCKIDAVKTKNDAIPFKGIKIYIKEREIPKLEENEFYVKDLLSKSVTTPSGNITGSVVSVHNFGAGDILELSLNNKTIMCPLSNIFILEIKDGIITLHEENIISLT